jgi:arylsulfatase A-like enzyme
MLRAMDAGAPKRFSLSAPAAGALLGILVGFADWLVVATDWGHSQSGMWYLPPFAWLAVVWTSVTLCTAAGILFASPRLGRLRGGALAVAGLGFVLVRGARPLRESLGLSTALVLLTWLAAILIVAVPLAFLPLRATRHRAWWMAGTAASVILLAILAANPDFGTGRRQAPDRASRLPNVVLIFLDTTRYDDVFGSASAMPSLDTFARQAASFDNAWAAAPWTVPSHYSVLTGTDPWSVPFGRGGFQRQAPSLAARLRARGYDTAAILANPLLGNPDFSPGFGRFTYSRQSGVCRSAFGELLDRLWVHGGPRSPLCGWLIASEVTDRALRYVRGARGPYFLVVNYLDGHYPYYVPPDCRDHALRMMSRSEREAFRHFGPSSAASPAMLQHAREQHRAAIRCMDRSLGTLLAALQQQPETAVIVVGDHGEQFGEHGLVEHGNSLYAQVLHVPLIVRAPGFRGRIADAVSITDLYGSILSIAGAGGSTPALLDGRSRRPAAASFDASSVSNPAEAWSVVRGQYHFIAWRGGREALYDLAADPFETAPLSTTERPGATVAPSLRALAAQVATSSDPRRLQFRALDYMQ